MLRVDATIINTNVVNVITFYLVLCFNRQNTHWWITLLQGLAGIGAGIEDQNRLLRKAKGVPHVREKQNEHEKEQHAENEGNDTGRGQEAVIGQDCALHDEARDGQQEAEGGMDRQQRRTRYYASRCEYRYS